jgi:signal transduction histidine kinase
LLQHFIDASSHDLSTPITTLLMSVKLLKLNAAQAPEQLQKLQAALTTNAENVQTTITRLDQLTQAIGSNTDRIDVSVQRLQVLLTGMLELAQLDKEFTLHPVPIDLNQLAREVVSEMEMLAQARNIQLNLATDPALGPLLLDQKEFRRALNHLLRNAINFTQAEGRVCLKTYQQHGQTVLEVSDNGMGIEPDAFYL